jgi:(1->4)-alpha-D-glucan 1-alpha-D-glucosylmutase
MDELREVRIPAATYRLQLHRNFGFDRATELVEYLHDLGVTDIYLSPVTTARKGSTHGYDVVDTCRINPELGGEEGFDRLTSKLREKAMGVLLDVVPNHMCIDSPDNPWWADLLESGRSSPFASYFDIDWKPPKSDLEDKVLLPVLEESFGNVLERREIKVVFESGAFFARYYDNRFPLAPETWEGIIDTTLENMKMKVGESAPAVKDLDALRIAIKQMPSRGDTNPEHAWGRYQAKELIKKRFLESMERNRQLQTALEESLSALNDERNIEHLASLLDEQPYRLSHWPVAGNEINYRRFFDINGLAAIRVEDPDVMQATHELVFGLVDRGAVTGLRIDHVDGLRDPLKYLCRLPPTCYVVVEKVLEGEERLRSDWPASGTTGYDFLNLLNGLYVDQSSASSFRGSYAYFTGRRLKFSNVLYESKTNVLETSMWGDLVSLVLRLDRISEQHYLTRDFTQRALRNALIKILACFPVYRTYVREEDRFVGPEDRHAIQKAIETAKKRSPKKNPSIFDFIASVLLLEEPDGLEPFESAERREFVIRFQQLSGPVMAKGLEDTAFYRYYPLVSANEVGGDPARFGLSVEAFHRAMKERSRSWPHGLSASSTHDAKRDEDVRARINVLSEMPRAWHEAVCRWKEINRAHKRSVDGNEVPGANEEYLLYQILVGAWPTGRMDDASYAQFVDRMSAYMVKAAREAKLHTSWISPSGAHEETLVCFIRSVLDRREDNCFPEDFLRFQASILHPGLLNSISQTLLKITSPGVPDFYQGTEMWDFRLVDPDNRRPVDFSKRRRALTSLTRAAEAGAAPLADRLLQELPDGRLKLHVTTRALRARRRRLKLFIDGDYIPLEVDGKRKNHAIAFARRYDDDMVLALSGRFFSRLPDPPIGTAWKGTRLRTSGEWSARYRDALTDETIELEDEGDGCELDLSSAFTHLPVALLCREGTDKKVNWTRL